MFHSSQSWPLCGQIIALLTCNSSRNLYWKSVARICWTTENSQPCLILTFESWFWIYFINWFKWRLQMLQQHNYCSSIVWSCIDPTPLHSSTLSPNHYLLLLNAVNYMRSGVLNLVSKRTAKWRYKAWLLSTNLCLTQITVVPTIVTIAIDMFCGTSEN